MKKPVDKRQSNQVILKKYENITWQKRGELVILQVKIKKGWCETMIKFETEVNVWTL